MKWNVNALQPQSCATHRALARAALNSSLKALAMLPAAVEQLSIHALSHRSSACAMQSSHATPYAIRPTRSRYACTLRLVSNASCLPFLFRSFS